MIRQPLFQQASNFCDKGWWQKAWNNASTLTTNRKRVVGLSGGKDSTALSVALSIFEPADYTFVCTPTGNELPEMGAHWEKLEGLLGRPLLRVGSRTLLGLIVEQKAIPNHAQRWCTRLIKLKQYYEWLAQQGPCISYIGLRADEESRPGMVFPDQDGVVMDFPMRRWGWTIDDVWEFLRDMQIAVPARTDCALCFWQKLGEWYELWLNHPDLYEQGVIAEDFVSNARGSEYTFRSPSRDTWPASLRDLRAEFEKGRVPTRSLNGMDKLRQSGACRVCTL